MIHNDQMKWSFCNDVNEMQINMKMKIFGLQNLGYETHTCGSGRIHPNV